MLSNTLSRSKYVLAMAALCALPAMAQKWEFGAGGGASFYTNKDITNRVGTAETGFSKGYSATAWLGQDSFKLIGGEIRYHFAKNDLRLASGGTSTGFSAHTHTVGYNVLIHTQPKNAKVRPYVLFGGGVKIFRGTGTPRASQPLSQFAALTNTDQPRPYVQFGGGVKVNLGEHLYLRAEVTDQLSPFPTDVILPVGGGSVSGWIHNILPVIGIGVAF
ncbi:MAG: outer membrane beta-barrel protein [Acidobacteria bacterium]|nr:outer membrane beta-barrel protein [Acidobacteriota bacterium]